jgi:hypothetical protein
LRRKTMKRGGPLAGGQEGFSVTIDGSSVASTQPQEGEVIVTAALTFADWNPGAVTWTE